jgi:hypothetical protein
VQDATEALPDTLKERYELVMHRVARAAERRGRRPEDILVVAVSKYAQMDDVRELYELGHRDFGESRPQQLAQRAAMTSEWLERRERFGEDPPEPARWHQIGRLQRNKVKKLLPDVRLIHSIDSMRLAEEIQTSALKREIETEALLQVNVSGETSKTGVTPPAAPHVAEQIDSMTYLRLRGLMTMAPLTDDLDALRSVFEQTATLFEDVQKLGISEGRFNILSMGMSHDYEIAIECGANCVRIGSSIFGEHAPEDEESEDD